ncbi:MAG: hypothetical protein WC483_06560 [Candidatus Paceibacterota bacterium]
MTMKDIWFVMAVLAICFFFLGSLVGYAIFWSQLPEKMDHTSMGRWAERWSSEEASPEAMCREEDGKEYIQIKSSFGTQTFCYYRGDD